jgi:hypothetical protein
VLLSDAHNPPGAGSVQAAQLVLLGADGKPTEPLYGKVVKLSGENIDNERDTKFAPPAIEL